MKEKEYSIEIDSDIGLLTLEVKYDIDYGQKGDYYTEPIPSSIIINSFTLIQPDEIPEHIMDEIVEEIEEHVQER